MTITFSNGLTLDLATGRDSFHGIGAVSFAGTPLRSAQLPWTFYTESESRDGAWRFEEFQLQDVQQDGTTATVTFTSRGRWLPRVQQADAMGDARIKTRRVNAPTATFRWRFSSITERIWESEWHGLAMHLEVDSPGWPIHWVLEETTWEIGGRAEGNVLIQQDISTIDFEQIVATNSAFSTIEKFHTETEDAWGGNFPMDMLPRAAGAAICDFQTKDDLTLVLYAPKPGLTRARLQKFADEDIIHYTERPFIALTEHAVFPERKLLVHRAPAALQPHEKRNLWLDCFTHVRQVMCDVYGFKPEIPRPAVHAHLWDNDLKALGKTWSHPLRDALPQFKKLGYGQVFTHGVWESVTSDPDPKVTGNICSPYNFRFAEMFGGASAMRELVKTAQANGIDIFQWFSFHISSASQIWKDHPDWIMREANGDPWDGNYGTIWSGRIRSGYGQWFLDSVKRVREETGMAGIFWDSYQNLGVTCVDWKSHDRAPQAEEIWQMQVELQRLGYKQKCEIITIFGVSQVGTFGFENDAFRRRLWADTVRNDDIFALLDCSPGFFTNTYPFTHDKLHPEFYFWLVAHRVVPTLGARPWGAPDDAEHAGPALPGGDLADDYARVNHLYHAALPDMHRLRLQPGGGWLLWLDEANRPAVAWSFKESIAPLQGRLRNIETGEETLAKGEAKLAANTVYRIEPEV